MNSTLRIASCLYLLIHILVSNSSLAQTRVVTHGAFQALETVDGVSLIPPTYERIGWSNGLNLPVDGVIGYFNKGWGLVTLKNKALTAPKYYSLEAIHKNLIIAAIKGKFSNELIYGVLNSKGNVIVDFKYHSIAPLEDLLIVSKRQTNQTLYGILNESNQVLLPLEFKAIEKLSTQLFKFVDTKKKCGVINQEGNILIESKLDSIAPFKDERAKIFLAGKTGLINSLGTLIHEPIYKSIDESGETIAFDTFYIMNKSGSVLKTFSCDSILELSQDLLVIIRSHHFQILNLNYELIFEANNIHELVAFKKNFAFTKNGKNYFIKYNGESIAPQGFDSLIYDQSYLYGYADAKWQIYNKYGSLISKKKFDGIKPNSNNLIPVQQRGYWGYLDHSGHIAIPIKFNQAFPFQANIAKVNYLGFNHIINQFGEVIGDHPYDEINIGQQNIALAKMKSRTDLIDNHSEIYFQTFNTLTQHPFGYEETTENGKVGIISHFGAVILAPIYDSISPVLHRHYIGVKKDSLVGLINFKGHWTIPLTHEFQSISHVGNQYIGIQKNDQFGFIDYAKRLHIANRYDSTKSFTQHRAAIKLHHKWGFIDEKEHLIIQPNYDEVQPFKDGSSIVRRNHKWGLINLDGKNIIKCELDYIDRTSLDYFLTQKEGKLGLYNAKGEALLTHAYNRIIPLAKESFIVERRGLTGLLDATGRYAIPLKYDLIIPITKERYICKKAIE